jgi:2-amino-4-hydroxy-6-hydroxymethyldihydropteridine diphosphokinase
VIREQRLRVELDAVLSLGSNLGDREQTIRDAVRDIRALPGVRVVAASGLVETAALKLDGVDTDAPAYLNAVLIVRTALAPEALLDALNAIEHEHGRVRAERWGDRTLDIDIVSIDGLVQSTERLILPHPRAAERGFVLVPWLQADSDAELPGLGRVDALLASSLAATRADVRHYPAKGLL